MNSTSLVEPTASELKSDLALFCFRTKEHEENQPLAYANSICFCFVLLALLGLQTPLLHLPPSPPPVIATVPVLFHPPETTKLEPAASDNQEPEQATFVETPQIVPVFVADPRQVAFSVPVEGPVMLLPAKFAPPPPRQETPRGLAGTPQPVEFHSGTATDGYYPDPDYPRSALRRRMEGRVLLHVVVDDTGLPKTVELRDSSGWPILDDHVLNWVKQKWQWPPGAMRYYLVPFRFQIK